MTAFKRAVSLKESLAGPPSRRAAYYAIAQASYACLAGSFEMPMAFRLAGRIDLVAFVYAFYYTTLFFGFALGSALVSGGRSTRVYRAALALWAALSLGSAALFPQMRGIGALIAYFLVRGLAEGLYWSARHRAFLWSVRDSGRDRFALKLQSIVVSLSVVLPLLGGFAITYLGPRLSGASSIGSGVLPSGYVPVFLLTGFVMLLFLALSPKLDIGRSSLSFNATFGLLKLREAKSWRAYIVLVGFMGAILSVSAGIQTFGVLKTEFKIGALNAGIALLSSLSFFLLGRRLAGRKEARLHGVLVGSLADFCSRAVYAIAPTTAGLGLKSLLDALLVPLKSLLGENVQFALIERLCRKAKAGPSDLYVFREALLWLSRVFACAATGLAFFALSELSGGSISASAAGASAASEGAARLTARILIGIAASGSLLEYLLIASFAKANAAAAAGAAEGEVASPAGDNPH